MHRDGKVSMKGAVSLIRLVSPISLIRSMGLISLVSLMESINNNYKSGKAEILRSMGWC